MTNCLRSVTVRKDTASQYVTVDLDRRVVSVCENDDLSSGSIQGCIVSDEETPISAAKKCWLVFSGVGAN